METHHMLVLSRRPNEKIVFPNLGITVQIIQAKPNAVRIGIDAPPEVRVLRDELISESAPPPGKPRRTLSHALCNRLNQVALGLHRFEQQWHAGQTADAGATLEHALEVLESLDQDFVKSNVAEEQPVPVCRTLLVDDDNNERELLAGILTMNGCTCATANDGVEAIDYLAAHEPPDLVLLDMLMPRCDGPHTLARIRSEPRFAGLKVFAISGTRPTDLGMTVGPGGVDAWFTKPLNPRKLWHAIRESVGAGRN